jgi:hypothetical protein
MALCYKDQTFCNSDCTNSACFRFIHKDLFTEANDFGLPVAMSDFSPSCEYYTKEQ